MDDDLIELLRTQEASVQAEQERLFKPGERTCLTEVPFAGIEGIHQLTDGERRVIKLLEILSNPVAVRAAPASFRNASRLICLVIACLGKNLSRSHDGVAQFTVATLLLAPFNEFYCSGPASRTR